MKDICFKAAFFDIDGTLLTTKMILYKETEEAIKVLKESGCKIIISTGRNIYVVPDNIKKLCPDYYIAGNGTAIYDHNEGLIRKHTISKETYYRLLSKYGQCPEYGMSLRYLSGIVSVYNDQRLNEFFSRFGTGKHRKPIQIDPDDELPSNGIICTDENIDIIREKFPELSFTCPLEKYYDFTPSSISKGTAVKELCTLMNIEEKETISFGDGESDVDMFNVTGYSIAMGNADDNVKKCANFITDPVENNGLAKAIYKICIGGQI